MILANQKKTSHIKKAICFLFLVMLLPQFVNGQHMEVEKKSNIFTRSKFKPLPLISYNRSKGYTLGAILSVFSQIKEGDTISPKSRTIVATGFTQNKSWFGAGGQQLYLNNDNLRISWGLGLGKSNFQYFETIDGDAEGMYIDYNTDVKFFIAKVIHKVYDKLYAGLNFTKSETYTKFEDPSTRPDEKTKLSSLGIALSFDSRNYIYYPAKGWYINTQINRFAGWLGSDEEYTSLVMNANNFISLNNKNILASRAYIYAGLGDVPFVGQKAIGGKDLRGYTQGKYRSDKKTAIQTEWRNNFYKKWGMVAFGGVAYAFKTTTAETSGLLPAGGVGLRYSIIPKMKMNAGMDFAVGKGDYGIYFRVGEAF